MAVLPDADRGRCNNAINRYLSQIRDALTGINSADIRAAVNAADDWVDSNAASYNTALPATFRTSATASQKALLLAVVVIMRHSPTLVRRIFGEID